MTESSSYKRYLLELDSPQIVTSESFRDAISNIENDGKHWSNDLDYLVKGTNGRFDTIQSISRYLFPEAFCHKRNNQYSIKTNRDEDIEKLRSIPGVNVREVPPSGYYFVHARGINDDEWSQIKAAGDQGGYQSAEPKRNQLYQDFIEAVWPDRKNKALDLLAQRDDVEKYWSVQSLNANLIVVKTDSEALVQALSNIPDVAIIEQPYGTTDSEIEQLFDVWTDKRVLEFMPEQVIAFE